MEKSLSYFGSVVNLICQFPKLPHNIHARNGRRVHVVRLRGKAPGRRWFAEAHCRYSVYRRRYGVTSRIMNRQTSVKSKQDIYCDPDREFVQFTVWLNGTSRTKYQCHIMDWQGYFVEGKLRYRRSHQLSPPIQIQISSHTPTMSLEHTNGETIESLTEDELWKPIKFICSFNKLPGNPFDGRPSTYLVDLQTNDLGLEWRNEARCLLTLTSQSNSESKPVDLQSTSLKFRTDQSVCDTNWEFAEFLVEIVDISLLEYRCCVRDDVTASETCSPSLEKAFNFDGPALLVMKNNLLLLKPVTLNALGTEVKFMCRFPKLSGNPNTDGLVYLYKVILQSTVTGNDWEPEGQCEFSSSSEGISEQPNGFPTSLWLSERYISCDKNWEYAEFLPWIHRDSRNQFECLVEDISNQNISMSSESMNITYKSYGPILKVKELDDSIIDPLTTDYLEIPIKFYCDFNNSVNEPLIDRYLSYESRLLSKANTGEWETLAKCWFTAASKSSSSDVSRSNAALSILKDDVICDKNFAEVTATLFDGDITEYKCSIQELETINNAIDSLPIKMVEGQGVTDVIKGLKSSAGHLVRGSLWTNGVTVFSATALRFLMNSLTEYSSLQLS